MPYFARVTPNNNDWTSPSGHAGKCPGTPNEPNFECFAGFGFEEWFRNPCFQEMDENGDIWQYGYLQCFKLAKGNHLQNNQDTLFEDVCLWTRYCIDGCEGGNVGQAFPVAYISEIVVLNDESRKEKNAHFFNCFNQIEVQLNNLIGQDAVNEFIHGPGGHSRLNLLNSRIKCKKIIKNFVRCSVTQFLTRPVV